MAPLGGNALLINGILVRPSVVTLNRRENIFTADRLIPNDTQIITLSVIGVVFMMVLMHRFGRYLSYPFEVSEKNK